MDYNNNSNMQPNNTYDSSSQDQFIHNPGQTMATMSLIFGVASIFTLCTVYPSMICAGVAIVLAILSKGYGKKMLSAAKIGAGTAIGGMVLIITLLASIIGPLLFLSADELIKFGRETDTWFERESGQKMEEVVGMSYEDLMEMYVEVMGK